MLDLGMDDLWLRYVGMGGDLPLAGLDGFFGGLSDLAEHDYDRLVQVVNEIFMDRDEDHPVPYSDEIDELNEL
jgi:hypothetical protein